MPPGFDGLTTALATASRISMTPFGKLKQCIISVLIIAKVDGVITPALLSSRPRDPDP